MRGVYRRGINVAEAAGGIKHYFSIKSESGAVYIYIATAAMSQNVLTHFAAIASRGLPIERNCSSMSYGINVPARESR